MARVKRKRRKRIIRPAWVDVRNPDVLDVCVPYQATTRHSWQGQVDPTTKCWEFHAWDKEMAGAGDREGHCSVGVDEAPGGDSWSPSGFMTRHTRAGASRPARKRAGKPYTASVHFWPSEKGGVGKRPVTVFDKKYKGLAEALEAAKIAYNVCISKAQRGGMPETRSYPPKRKKRIRKKR